MTGAPRQRAPLMKNAGFAIDYMNNIQQYNYHCSLMWGIMWQMNISSPGQPVHLSFPRMPDRMAIIKKNPKCIACRDFFCVPMAGRNFYAKYVIINYDFVTFI